MEIRNIGHYPEMEQMLKTIPKWIYYAGNGLIVIMIFLLLFICNNIENRQITNIQIEIIAMNDTTLTMTAQFQSSEAKRLLNGELYILQSQRNNDTSIDSLYVKLLDIQSSKKTNSSNDSIYSITCYIPCLYKKQLMNDSEHYHSLIHISKNTLMSQIKKSFRININ